MPRQWAPIWASEMVLLMWSFSFGIKRVGELTSYGQSRWSTPAVIRTRWVSDFWGLMLQTQLAYVIFQSLGTYNLWMKNMVPVPAMRSLSGRYLPTPLGRSPLHLLALEKDQTLVAEPLIILSREGCFPAASWWGVARAAMWWKYRSMLTFW